MIDMNEHMDDDGQFKMRLDGDGEGEDSPISADVEGLRIEKLNHRVTLISILIPVLIVVVLTIAYLDIKKRVIQTEDSGQLTAQTLSKELESRFETLALTQKVLDENLARLKDQSDQSLAKVQVNLKKLDDRMTSANKNMLSRKDMQASTDVQNQKLNNISQAMEELKIQLDQFTEAIQSRLSELENTLTADSDQVTRLEETMTAIEQNKMDKSAMDLAIKLEVLKAKQTYQVQLDDLQTRLKSIEGRIARQTSRSAPAPQSSPSPAPAAPAPPPGKLQEQTIGK